MSIQVSPGLVPLPSSAGGGFGQAVDKRPLAGGNDTQVLVTYKPLAGSQAAAPALGDFAPQLGGGTVTVVQQVTPCDPDTRADLPGVLDSNEEAQVSRLAARDSAVRAEESAHKSMAGAFSGPIHYDYTRGPDGRLYATGGHVSMTSAGVANRYQMEQAMGAFAAAGRVPAATSAADFLSAQSGLRGLAEIGLSKAEEARSAAAPRFDILA